MIELPKTAPCWNCTKNPAVFQPSTQKETEWICCDKYKATPVPILKGNEKCEFFERTERGSDNGLQS